MHQVRLSHKGILSTFIDHIIPALFNIVQSMEKEGKFPRPFYETSVILIPVLDKDGTKKETYRPLSLMNSHVTILNKTLATAH